MRESQDARLWYLSLYEVSRSRRIRYLTEGYGAERLFSGAVKKAQMKRFFTEEECSVIMQNDRKAHAHRLSEALEARGIRFCFFHTPAYPGRLMEIPDPPCGLFYRGALPRDDLFYVGIVGARMCTEYGRRIAQELGRRLAACGIGVISGMAAGIDAASHAGALMADGITHAVLGCGCDVCYPASSANLYRSIPEKGSILSEYIPGTKPFPRFFPERNRLISGLSDVILVVEAKERSGSLITADCALEQGRDVYAVPGRITDRTSAGCNRLIGQGAFPLCDTEQFLQDMCRMAAEKRRQTVTLPDAPAAPALKHALEKEEQLVYSCLDLHPKNVFILLEETGLPLERLLAALAVLTDGGLAEEARQNAYVRTSVMPVSE